MSLGFFATEETATVRLDDQGHYVELKRELDYGEEGDLQGASLKAGLQPDGTPKVEVSLRQLRLLTIAIYLVDWNLTNAQGKRVPLPSSMEQRVELVARLRPAWAEKIAEAIAELRAEPSSENGQAEAPSGKNDDPDPTAPGVGSAPGMP